MAKDPAILFYTSDFISGTLTMSHEQRGKYILLLCLQHQKGHLSEKDMLNICGTYDEDIFVKFTKSENGLYYNQRLQDEMSKRQRYSDSRRKNRLGGDKSDIICKSYVEHMEDINKDIIKEGESEGKKKETVIYREDYDKFLKETDSEPYHAFVKFLFGVNPNINKMDRCLSLGYQIDHARFQELMKLYPRDLIKTKVEAMENKIDLTKKYKSFYLTLKNWCKAG